MRVGLTTTAIFGDLSGYFSGIFRDKTSSIIWRHAIPCRPVTDCKMNDLDCPWAAIWRKNSFLVSTLLQHICVFGAHCTNLNEDRLILSATKMLANDSSFWKYKVHVDICGCSLGLGVKQHWGLSTTAIFGDLGGYAFENFRDTASSIMWRYATRCRPANDCKINDLEWCWVAISWENAFSSSTSWIRAFECQQEAQLPQRNSTSAAHTCAADALFLCGSCIGIGTCRSWNAQSTAESPRLYYFWHSNALIQEVLAKNAFFMK